MVIERYVNKDALEIHFKSQTFDDFKRNSVSVVKVLTLDHFNEAAIGFISRDTSASV